MLYNGYNNQPNLSRLHKNPLKSKGPGPLGMLTTVEKVQSVNSPANPVFVSTGGHF